MVKNGCFTSHVCKQPLSCLHWLENYFRLLLRGASDALPADMVFNLNIPSAANETPGHLWCRISSGRQLANPAYLVGPQVFSGIRMDTLLASWPAVPNFFCSLMFSSSLVSSHLPLQSFAGYRCRQLHRCLMTSAPSRHRRGSALHLDAQGVRSTEHPSMHAFDSFNDDSQALAMRQGIKMASVLQL